MATPDYVESGQDRGKARLYRGNPLNGKHLTPFASFPLANE
jgi:hypothetical protein